MKNKSIKKNMFMSLVLTTSNFVFPLITFSYVSRVLTPIGTGKVAFVNSILSYFIYFALLGVNAYGLREAAKARDDKKTLSKLVKELLTINIISTCISYFILILSIILIPKLFEYKYLFIIMSSTILLNSIGVEWLYKALEEYSYITTRSLFFKILYIPLVFLLIRNQNDYLMYGFLSIFVSSGNYICNFVNLRKYVDFKSVKKMELKKHLKPLFILLLGSTAITIYNSFDVSMLGFINTEYEVGLYNAAYKIRNILTSLSVAITSVLIPRIAFSLGKQDKKTVKDLVLLSLNSSFLIAFPVVIYCLIFTSKVLLLICGKDFIGASSALIVLLWCVIVLIFTNLFGNQLMLPMGKEKEFSICVSIGLVINVVLNFLLIPKYGAYGAAIGTLCTEVWNAIFMGYSVRTYILHAFSIKNLYKYVLSAIFAGLISYYVSLFLGDIQLIYYVAVSGISFFFVYYLSLYLLGETIVVREMRKVLKRLMKQ